MVHEVRLERLPDGLQFPPELSSKISYDATRKQLEFDGFMSKVDFDKLLRLHNDLAYQKSLEQLFQICTFPAKKAQEKPKAPWGKLSLAVAGVAAVIVFAFISWRMLTSPADAPTATHANDVTFVKTNHSSTSASLAPAESQEFHVSQLAAPVHSK